MVEQEVMHGISRTVQFGVTQTPINLTTSLIFDFEETDDYSFVFNLYRIARSFIRFCCYRRSVYISEAVLSSPYKGATHLNVATIENLNTLVNSSKGKERSIYRRLAGYVKSDSLQPEISHIGKELASIITVFGERLYRLNGEDLNYNEMGKRLAKQRNDFAHGNLDKDFDELAFLDLIFMERIIYAMQLKYYEVEEIKIQKSINDLFRSGIMIKESTS